MAAENWTVTAKKTQIKHSKIYGGLKKISLFWNSISLTLICRDIAAAFQILSWLHPSNKLSLFK